MSERKGINRYYPPDQDPSQVRFSAKAKKAQKNGKPKSESIRLMIPFSMKCLKCNEYISKSRKFNARKEITNRDYLGIKILKFEIRCPRCFGDIIFETDPKNSGYQCISGCKKNYEGPQEVKNNETMDEMIARLEKEMKEDEKMQELKKKGGNNIRNGLITKETGMEQLEKRLAEQQKEKERMEELELLQERVENFQNRRTQLESNEDKVDDNENKLLLEAKNAFKKYKKTKHNKPTSLLSGYSSSDTDDDDDDNSVKADRSVLTSDLKRSQEPIKDVVKRKKPKIIT